MLKSTFAMVLILFFVSIWALSSVAAQLSGTVNFVVLHVTFSDFGTATRFTQAQLQTDFNNIATLWGNQSSYGNISLQYQFAGPYQVASPSGTYLDQQNGQFSSGTAIQQLVKDAVAGSPNSINWSNVYGVLVLFGDTRTGGFYRGVTWPSTISINPPSGGTFNVHASIVGESPLEDETTTWGRWAHEMGHEMQANPGNPWHPSNYNSDFEQMDAEYPAQSGMFNKQGNMAYPGWMPAGKYKAISPPGGTSIAIFAEERPPGQQPDFQAIKASLTFGGPQLYYLVSVRHHILGDDVATSHGPNGIPDEGVLIERVVEGGDPNVNDCTAAQPCNRWVVVEGNGGPDKLWHVGDSYKNQTDGIFITVRANPDADHYLVDVAYADKAGQPDVGLNSWLQPPSNSYETTDIWIDSPVNGYGTFRYGTWSDLMGGTVPTGNGDDPAVGQDNRLYARVRNYGSVPAANVVVHFDITNPPGLGINGSNGFTLLGSVDKTKFPGLALINPGALVDVYLDWTPNFTLTPQQIQQGRFFFHTCVRVRLDHVIGETFFGNQDGDGQQENIDYFDAGGAGGAPGAPGPPNHDIIRVRNDSFVSAKEFVLSVDREHLPTSWKVVVNNGNPIVTLAPGQTRDVPVVVEQTQTEPVGSRHFIKVVASSHVTLQNKQRPTDYHEEFKPLGGVEFQVAVLRRPKVVCTCKGGVVRGSITGLDPHDGEKEKEQRERGLSVYVAGLSSPGKFLPGVGALAYVHGGKFEIKAPEKARFGVCLYAGSQFSASAGSQIFPIHWRQN